MCPKELIELRARLHNNKEQTFCLSNCFVDKYIHSHIKYFQLNVEFFRFTGGPHYTLYFGVKFYAADPTKLKEELTR